MEYFGYVKDIIDSILLVEAARNSYLKYQTSRPNLAEHNLIKPGKTIIINESKSGIKRWVDGKLWTSSRLISGFFIYKELTPKVPHQDKSDRRTLYKKMVSLINPMGEHIHLINYYTEPTCLDTFKTSNVINYINSLPSCNLIKSKVGQYQYCKDFRTKEKSWKNLSFPEIRNFLYEHKVTTSDDVANKRKVSTINLILNYPQSQSSSNLNNSDLPSLKELDLMLEGNVTSFTCKKRFYEDFTTNNEDLRQLNSLRKFLKL